MRTLFAILLFFLAAGCSPTVRNVTGDPAYPDYQGDYIPGSCYQLSQPATMVPLETGPLPLFASTPRYELFPPKQRYEEGAPILPAGTRLRFRTVLYHNYVTMDNVIPVAELTDGKWRGRRVGIGHLSRETEASRARFQDPAWLVPYDGAD